MASLDHNPDGVQFLIIQAVFTCLAVLAVALRLWARRLTDARIDWSDYTCLIALVFVLGQAGTGITSVLLGGVGLHSVVLSSQQLTVARQTLFAGDVCWMVANCFVKLSILRFLHTIFRRKPWFSRTIGPLSILVMLAGLACVLGRFLQCRPFASIWDPTLPGGGCVAGRSMSVGAATISLVLDLVIFILPIPIILRLQMRRMRKLAIVAVFGLGAVICVISGLRIASIFTIDLTDITSSMVSPSQWSILDNTLGVVSACLPLLPPILQHTTGHDFFAWTRRPSQQMSPMHSPASSLQHDGMVPPPRAYRRSGHDMASLAWGGSNRTPSYHLVGKGGTIWESHPVSSSSRRHAGKSHGYRGLGGRHERARGPPLAFNPNYFYPPAMRRTISHHGSVSSTHSPSFRSSVAPPSRSLSQRHAADPRRSTSRHGSRVASRLGSRGQSRSNSRMTRRGENDDEHEAPDRAVYSAHGEADSKTRVAIVSYGRAPSPDPPPSGHDADHAPAMMPPNGITVTTTWDIDVESLQSGMDDDEEEADPPYEYDGEYRYGSRSGSFHSRHAPPELVDLERQSPCESRKGSSVYR